MLKDRLNEEQTFHDKRFGEGRDERDSASKYYVVRRGSRRKYDSILSKICNGKRVLEYGCGSGTGSERLLNFGAILTGIDISAEGVMAAKKKLKYSAYKAEYYVMNVEQTEFEDETFDVVAGLGIIHHLDLKKAYNEASRILKKRGHAVFEEPLGHNPFINFYRVLTPNMRTSSEHPLKHNDIELLKKYFKNVETEYFSLFTIFSVPFRNMKFFEQIYNVLERIDRLIFNIPFMKKYAWTVLIHASQPQKIFTFKGGV
jgi:ubiquinone/menaquinone biosynthesis C-methylase UbiE